MKEIPDPLGLLRDTDKENSDNSAAEPEKSFKIEVKFWPDKGVKIPVKIRKK